MISRPIQLFTPAAAGTMQHHARNQEGLPDFGPLLDNGTDMEEVRGGMKGGNDASLPGTGAAQQHQLPDRPPQIPGSMSAAALANTPTEAERIIAGALGERSELVSMRWGLRANAGLSYLTIKTDAQGGAPHSMSEDPALPQTESSAPAKLFTFATVDETAPAGEWLHSLQLLEVAPEHDVSWAESAPSMRTDPAPVATTASTAWPERLLRWLATTDGKGATAWIRDYQMGPSQAARMVDSLRSLATQQGQQLHRIVLNGHELWRSASTQLNNQRDQ